MGLPNFLCKKKVCSSKVWFDPMTSPMRYSNCSYTVYILVGYEFTFYFYLCLCGFFLQENGEVLEIMSEKDAAMFPIIASATLFGIYVLFQASMKHVDGNKSQVKTVSVLNPFASGIKKVFLDPITGLFSVKIWKKILAIKNFSVNDTMSGQPNKRLIHWHFEN